MIEKPAEEENNKTKEKVDNLPEEEDQAELYERLERDYYEMPRQQSEDSEDSDLISIKKNTAIGKNKKIRSQLIPNWKKNQTIKT